MLFERFFRVFYCDLWTKQIELVPYRATKISRKTQKHLFFPLIAKLVCFSCVFLCATKGNVAKNTRKGMNRTRDQSLLNEYPNDWDTNDLRKKRNFRRALYLLTNKKESVVLGSLTFESSTTNLRHMLGLYVSLRNTRKKLLFLPGHKERVLSVSFTFIFSAFGCNFPFSWLKTTTTTMKAKGRQSRNAKKKHKRHQTLVRKGKRGKFGLVNILNIFFEICGKFLFAADILNFSLVSKKFFCLVRDGTRIIASYHHVVMRYCHAMTMRHLACKNVALREGIVLSYT